MTAALRLITRRGQISMPVVEIGFFMMIVLMTGDGGLL
jgi:hypothetical protein